MAVFYHHVMFSRLQSPLPPCSTSFGPSYPSASPSFWLLPVMLFYNAYQYRVFRGKVEGAFAGSNNKIWETGDKG
jgi:hypothetical protein